jgi:GT2 family glycosyltransferase
MAPDVPIVDVWIPVLERVEFVARAVESVLGQSYPGWRLTIAQDGPPTDGVRRAVAPYLDDPRVSYRAAGRRLGIAALKNELIASSHAPYFTVLDDDDFWMDGWLARRVEFLDGNPECVLVWSAHVDVDGSGREVARRPPAMSSGVHSAREFTTRMIEANLIATPSVLVRRSAYAAAGGRFDPRFVYISDYELWLRLGMTGPVGFLGVYDSAYRVHAQQASQRRGWADDFLLLGDHVDGLLAGRFPELRADPRRARRMKADRLLSSALDAAGRSERRLALGRILAAARLAPGALGSRRGAAAVVAALGGEAVRRRVDARRP